MKRLYQIITAYAWYYHIRAKLLVKKHILRPLLKQASQHGLIAGRRRV